MATTAHIPELAALGAGAGPAIGRHMDRAFRALVLGARWTGDARFLRMITGEPHPLGNLALISAPADADTTREAADPLVASALPAAVIFPDLEAPAAADAWLTGQGFVAHGALPAMGVDIAALKPTALPDGYELVRVGAGADGEEWVRQFSAGYELPLGVAECFSPVALQADTSPDARLQFFAIRRNGAIVCTSVCYLDEGVAGIYCVATIPTERNKGLGGHATAEPLRLAAKIGYRVGVLQASEAGHPVYRSLGFTDFGGLPLYVRIPG